MNTRGTLASLAAVAVCLSSAGLRAQAVPSKLSEEVQKLPDAAKPNEAGPVVALPVPGFDPVTNPAPAAMNRNEATTALIATTYSANWLSEGLSQLEREDLAQKGQRQTRSQVQRRGQADSLTQQARQKGQRDLGWQSADRATSGNRFSTRDPSLNFGGFAPVSLRQVDTTRGGTPSAGGGQWNSESRFEPPTKPVANPYLETPTLQEPVLRAPAVPITEPAKPAAVPPSPPAPEPTPVVDAGKYFPQLKR